MSRDSHYVHHLWHMEDSTLETACPKFEFFPDFEPPEYFHPQRRVIGALPRTLHHHSYLTSFSEGCGGPTVQSQLPMPSLHTLDSKESLPSQSASNNNNSGGREGEDRHPIFPPSPSSSSLPPVIAGGEYSILRGGNGVVDVGEVSPPYARDQQTLFQQENEMAGSNPLPQRDPLEEEKERKIIMGNDKSRDTRFDELLALY